MLLEKFVQDGHVSSPDGIGLRLVRLTSEALLAQMLRKEADVHELFGCVGCRSSNQAKWVCFPRFNTQVLTADLRWRNPDWYAELHRRARLLHYAYSKTHAQEQHRVLFDYIFLHRDRDPTPFTWQEP